MEGKEIMKEQLHQKFLRERKFTKEFIYRLGKYSDALFEYYFTLYGNIEEFEEQYTLLIYTLHELYMKRSILLKERDRLRFNDFTWYRKTPRVGMAVDIRRYARNTTILHEKMDYFKELGVNYIQLLSEDADVRKKRFHEFLNIVKIPGTRQEFLQFSAEAQARDILLEVEVDLSYTYHTHPFAEKAQKGESYYQKYYHFYKNMNSDTRIGVNDHADMSDYHHIASCDAVVMSQANGTLWNLNYTNPNVFREIIIILSDIADLEIDCISFKNVVELTQKLKMDGITADILLRMIKVCMRIFAPGVVFKLGDFVAFEHMQNYVQKDAYGHIVFEYLPNTLLPMLLWDSIATQNIRVLRNGLDSIQKLSNDIMFVNTIQNTSGVEFQIPKEIINDAGYSMEAHHQFLINFFTGNFEDSFSFAAYINQRFLEPTSALSGLVEGLEKQSQKDVENALRRTVMLHCILLSLNGLPVLYYGDEIGTLQMAPPDQKERREDMKNQVRYRPIVDWSVVARKDISNTIEHLLFHNIKHAISIQKKLKEFHATNDFEILDTKHDTILMYLRSYGEEQTLILVNVSPKDEKINCEVFLKYIDAIQETKGPVYEHINLLTGVPLHYENNMLIMKKFETLWIKITKVHRT